MSNFPTLNISATQTINISRPLINTYFSASKTAIDNHVSGSSDKHDAAYITYSGNVTSATTAEGALDDIDTRIDNHTNGSSEKHAAQHITYSGDIAGATEVRSALNTLNTRIDTIVGYSGTSTIEVVDARESAVKSKTYTVLDDRLEAIEGEGPGYTYEGKSFVINNPYRFSGSLTLKGQLHCHTTNSTDAVDSPSALVSAYITAGYDFISITDHDYVTPDPSAGSIIFIQGVEDSGDRDVVAYNVTAETTAYTVQSIIDSHLVNNSLLSIAHPYLSGTYMIDKYELFEYRDYNFIEVYNSLSAFTGESQIDYSLSNGNKTFLLAVDDCHNISGANFNKGWIILNCNSASSTAILDSMRKGNFYASTGNDISISISGKVITASSVGNSNFSFVGRNGRVLQTNNGVTNAVYTIIGNEMYVRVKSIKVSDSTIAWSNPIFIDCLGDDSRQFSDIRPYHNSANKLINSNFDIWQRGTSFTYSSSSTFADKWGFFADAGIGGTLPTILLSRQSNSGVNKSYFYNRVNVDGAGVSLSTSSGGGLYQTVENGTRYLTGKGKALTLSFYARSDISNKKLGFFITQNYGTGGTPTAQEIINGQNISLTTTFTKYTHTFTTNTHLGKTFGTNNDDKITLQFYYFWGSSISSRVGSTASETFVGAGNIDIAQIQLCTGDTDLPFVPKTFDEELISCQRYYEKSYNISNVPGTANTTANTQIYISGTSLNSVPFKVKKAFGSATITLYSTDGTSGVIRNATATANITANTTTSESFFNITITSSQTLGDVISYHWTASAEI